MQIYYENTNNKVITRDFTIDIITRNVNPYAQYIIQCEYKKVKKVAKIKFLQ